MDSKKDPYENWQPGDPIEYIRKEIPDFELPGYEGERYEAFVPDTLDLQERAALAINCLTEPTNPDADYELYWIVNLNNNPPSMTHRIHDHVQSKFMEALPLLRLASGSDQNLHVERRRLEALLHMQGPDGLFYYPVGGRPWAQHAFFGKEPLGSHYRTACMDGPLLATLGCYHALNGEALWREAGEKMVQGLAGRVVERDGYVFLPEWVHAPGDPFDPEMPTPHPFQTAHVAWVLQGLVQFHAVTAYAPALELAGKFAKGLRGPTGVFGDDGSFLAPVEGTQEGDAADAAFDAVNGLVHFHVHTKGLLALADYADATGDSELWELVRRGYEFGRTRGEPLVGYYPEWTNATKFSTAETCEVAEMLVLAARLSLAGIGDYWDDVDRIVRNQFAEAQLTAIHSRQLPNLPLNPVNAPHKSSDRVIERNIGAFAGWPSPNDFGWGIMHCCTGNAARAIYYIWESILTRQADTLRVNLLLNRASPWVDVHSHLPYNGRVEIEVKDACKLAVRMPGWAELDQVRCDLNGDAISPVADGRYLIVGAVKPGDKVTFDLPLTEHEKAIWIEKDDFTFVLRGHEVVDVHPRGTKRPLYQRAHYRQGETRWRKVTRFVPARQLDWLTCSTNAK